MSQETVTLVLENLVYNSTEFRYLSKLLEEKYGFKKVEDDTQEVTKDQKPISKSSECKEDDRIVRTEVNKLSAHKRLIGNYLNAEIRVDLLGDVISTHTVLQITPEEQQSTYTTVYQMVKVSSESGFAIQKMIERLVVELGLIITKQEFTFHRLEHL